MTVVPANDPPTMTTYLETLGFAGLLLPIFLDILMIVILNFI